MSKTKEKVRSFLKQLGIFATTKKTQKSLISYD